MRVTSKQQIHSTFNRVPSESYDPGFFTRTFSKVAHDCFTAGQRLSQWTASKRTANDSLLKRLGLWFTETAGGMLLTQDYKEAIKVGRVIISEPPIGALILILLPFTIGGRISRAIERGHGDDREVYDILRRDVPAITIFLFALKPLVNFLNRLKEKFDGLKLVDNITHINGIKVGDGDGGGLFGKVFSYSQFEQNYKIENPKTIEAIVRHGNGLGLKKAADGLRDNGLTELLAKESDPQSIINQIRQAIPKLISAVENKAEQSTIDSLSEEIFNGIKSLDGLQEQAHTAAKSVSAKVLREIEKLPKYKNFFADYAKKCRLPFDILSFALVTLGIGLFPVVFNDWWNRKQFEEKQAAKKLEVQANYDPKLTFESLKRSSRLGQRFNAAP